MQRAARGDPRNLRRKTDDDWVERVFTDAVASARVCQEGESHEFNGVVDGSFVRSLPECGPAVKALYGLCWAVVRLVSSRGAT